MGNVKNYFALKHPWNFNCKHQIYLVLKIETHLVEIWDMEKIKIIFDLSAKWKWKYFFITACVGYIELIQIKIFNLIYNKKKCNEKIIPPWNSHFHEILICKHQIYLVLTIETHLVEFGAWKKLDNFWPLFQKSAVVSDPLRGFSILAFWHFERIVIFNSIFDFSLALDKLRPAS